MNSSALCTACAKARLQQRAAEVLAGVGLAEPARDESATFSDIQRRHEATLELACAEIHDLDVLLLDERTVGSDSKNRSAVFKTLLALKAAGEALVYTTHYTDEAERPADRVVVIDHGRVVASDTLPDLYRLLPAAQKLRLKIDGAPDAQALYALPGVRSTLLETGGSRWASTRWRKERSACCERCLRWVCRCAISRRAGPIWKTCS